MRKGFITFAAAMLMALCSCGGANYGTKKTAAEFDTLMASAQALTGLVDHVKVDLDSSLEVTGEPKEVVTGHFDGKQEDFDPTNESQVTALMAVETFTYEYAKAAVLEGGIPEDKVGYYANDVPEYTMTFDYSASTSGEGGSMEITAKATYRWDAHGMVIYVDEVSSMKMTILGQTVESKAQIHLTASYTYK